MKMKCNIILAAIFCILFVRCNSTVKQNETEGTNPNISAAETSFPIVFNLDIPEKNNKPALFSSYFKPNVKTIILETNDDVLIGAVSKLRVYNDLLFILDKNFAKKYLFSIKKGNFFIQLEEEAKVPVNILLFQILR